MQKVEFRETAYQSLVEYDLRESFKSFTQFEIAVYSGVEENRLGYDLEVLSLVPLFLQIKVSNFYPSFSRSALLAGRKALCLTDNPGCYAFSLHPDKKTSSYKQHELLAKLHATGSYSRYIAPLFHTSAALHHFKNKQLSPYWGPSPASLYHNAWITWRDYVSFDHSVSIIPHQVVNDATSIRHHYTYNSKRQVCFHSDPERSPDAESFVESVLDRLMQQRSSDPMSIDHVNGMIIDALREIGEIGQSLPWLGGRMQPLVLHRKLARMLKSRFDIECLLIAFLR